MKGRLGFWVANALGALLALIVIGSILWHLQNLVDAFRSGVAPGPIREWPWS
jgi:hypothetical protein